MLSGPFFKRIAASALIPALIAVATAAVTGPASARKKSEERAAEPEPTLNGRAAVAVVSIKDQRISLYDADGTAVRARISSGQTGYETPVGVFSILQKNEEHYSNLYDDAAMPFMQRITWSGVALHAGALPGYPASHGCVRLPHAFAKRIFSMTKLGMRVVISRDDIAPVGISHPLLPKPEPVADAAIATPASYEPENSEVNDERITIMKPDVRKWVARQALLDELRADVAMKSEEAKAAVTNWETQKARLKKFKTELALVAKRERAAETKSMAEKRLAAAEKKLAEAKSSRAVSRAQKEKEATEKSLASAETKLAEATKAAEEASRVVNDVNLEIAAAEKAKTAAVEAAAEAKRKTLPMSVFVSAKSQKLYIRQGNEPVFETKVAVADPELPIGTHVFTALDFASDANDVKWNVVTISRRSADSSFDDDYRTGSRKQKKSDNSPAPPVTDAEAAAAALERIAIPSEVRARISQHVWPGSSFIISDEELSKETGKDTDFIIVASDEPQGALKKRKRQPPRNQYRDYYSDDYYYSYRPPYPSKYGYGRRPPKNNGLFSFW